MERRTFLKSLPAMSFLATAASTMVPRKACSSDMNGGDIVGVRIDAPSDPLGIEDLCDP
jgi:hypothetical protein